MEMLRTREKLDGPSEGEADDTKNKTRSSYLFQQFRDFFSSTFQLLFLLDCIFKNKNTPWSVWGQKVLSKWCYTLPHIFSPLSRKHLEPEMQLLMQTLGKHFFPPKLQTFLDYFQNPTGKCRKHWSGFKHEAWKSFIWWHEQSRTLVVYWGSSWVRGQTLDQTPQSPLHL